MTSSHGASAHPELLRSVAAYGTNSTLDAWPAAPLEDPQFDRFLMQVRRQRLSGLAWKAAWDGMLPLTDGQAELLRELHARALAGCLVLEELACTVDAELSDRGIAVRVLKGPASAHLDYEDPQQRIFGDVDILVSGDDFDQSVAWLTSSGHRRRYPEPRPGFDRRFSKGASFETAGGLEVDLHRTFTMGPFGLRLDLAGVWSGSQDVQLGEARVPALSREARLLHACYHAALGAIEPRLVPLRDVVQLLGHPALDGSRFAALVRNSQADAVIIRTVRLLREVLGVAPQHLGALAEWHGTPLTPQQTADLAAYGVGSSYVTKAVSALRAIPGLRDKGAYLAALLFPSEAYVAGRHRDRWTRIAGGLRRSRIGVGG